MAVDYVQGAIRRSNRNILILSILGIVILVGAAALSYRYLTGFVSGPKAVDKATLLAAKSADA